MKNTHLSKHFSLGEFCNPNKYPDNIPTMQAVANMMQMAQTGIDEQDYYHSVRNEGEKVLELLNPQYAEGKRQARIIKDLQDRTDAQDKKLDQILSRLDEFFDAPKK